MLEHVADLPLFTFGSLLESELVSHMLERPVEAEPAQLLDFKLVELSGMDAVIPIEAPGETISGRLYRDLVSDDYVRLDAYQGVSERLYRRAIAVVAANAEDKTTEGAFVYLPTDQTLTRYG